MVIKSPVTMKRKTLKEIGAGMEKIYNNLTANLLDNCPAKLLFCFGAAQKTCIITQYLKNVPAAELSKLLSGNTTSHILEHVSRVWVFLPRPEYAKIYMREEGSIFFMQTLTEVFIRYGQQYGWTSMPWDFSIIRDVTQQAARQGFVYSEDTAQTETISKEDAQRFLEEEDFVMPRLDIGKLRDPEKLRRDGTIDDADVKLLVCNLQRMGRVHAMYEVFDDPKPGETLYDAAHLARRARLLKRSRFHNWQIPDKDVPDYEQKSLNAKRIDGRTAWEDETEADRAHPSALKDRLRIVKLQPRLRE